MQLDGGGVKPLSTNLEERVMDWISIQQSSGLRVSRKLVIKKEQLLYQEMSTSEGILKNEEFKASRRWLEKLMRGNSLFLRRKTSVAVKNPGKLIAKLVPYVIQICRMQKVNSYRNAQIIAMDETPVWNDMVSQTTVDACGKKNDHHENCRTRKITCVCLFGS